ncbi:hypothetical protein EMCG_03837 [[Emmonsia] crescens]|uniref:Uncharacterized protein n=1 Tax=[Emmonsia] crescens TaxID=73230 RepID=A0A0G2HU10_9EURO|nr:hypothetical protein EMCG_03837 [Emmonsia crescens UAMH 3008]
MAALRRKAAQGLNKIPSNKKEWHEVIQKYGLQQRTLEQLCMKDSCSLINLESEYRLLMLKKTLKDAPMYIANLEYFFNEDHLTDVTKLIKRNSLELDKLKTLYCIICTAKEPLKHTSSEYSGTLADELGPFSMLVNVYNQLLDRSIQASINEHPLGRSPEKTGFYDTTLLSAVVEPTSPTRQAFSPEELSMADIEMTDVGSQLIARYPARTCPPAMTSSTKLTDEEAPRRTPTETLVADFMVTLLSGLASLVQALNPRPLCIANSFETTYTFSPVRDTSQQQVDVQFQAHIDRSIPFSLSLAGMPREAAIFEAKCTVRGESGGSIPVLAQQSMEHVAYIWKRHEDDPMMIPTPYLCIIGTYDNTYLEYIFRPGAQQVLPTQGGIPFLKIQEFGPFDVTDKEELGLFLHIMLSFIVWQLERTDAGTTLKNALS